MLPSWCELAAQAQDCSQRSANNPSNAFWARTRLFRYLRKNHRLHHELRDKNYNVVCPLFDWIMGTKVVSVRSQGACGVR
jgi:hypothetical protein